MEVQLGNAAKAVINTAAPVAFRIDNSAPNPVQFTELRWRVAGGVWSPPMELICPVVNRPVVAGNPADIEFMISYQAAAVHLRSVSLSGGGCGGGNPTLISALSTAQHWHTNPADNSVINTAIASSTRRSSPSPVRCRRVPTASICLRPVARLTPPEAMAGSRPIGTTIRSTTTSGRVCRWR